MDVSDSQRLRVINGQLLDLYIKLHVDSLDVTQENVVRSKIADLESERDTLPQNVRYDDKIQQYVTILKSAASSLQLHRQSLQPYREKPQSQLSSDEIRQKNILTNKLKASEKKINTYRDKLTELGLLPFEVDDVILDGYREQNQRRLQQLLKSFEETLIEYLLDYYQQHQKLPESLLSLILSWDNVEQRLRLRSDELQIMTLHQKCIRSGIPKADIDQLIRSSNSWTDVQKQEHIEQLKTKLNLELTQTKDSDVKAQVYAWMEQFDQGTLVIARQVEIVLLVRKLQMYGVPQKRIDAVFEQVFRTNDNLIERFMRLFRSNS